MNNQLINNEIKRINELKNLWFTYQINNNEWINFKSIIYQLNK